MAEEKEGMGRFRTALVLTIAGGFLYILSTQFDDPIRPFVSLSAGINFFILAAYDFIKSM